MEKTRNDAVDSRYNLYGYDPEGLRCGGCVEFPGERERCYARMGKVCSGSAACEWYHENLND